MATKQAKPKTQWEQIEEHNAEINRFISEHTKEEIVDFRIAADGEIGYCYQRINQLKPFVKKCNDALAEINYRERMGL